MGSVKVGFVRLGFVKFCFGRLDMVRSVWLSRVRLGWVQFWQIG